MTEPQPSSEEISAWKSQQEANRKARLRQLHSPEELWRWQQQALSELAKLRPDGARPSRAAPDLKPENLNP